ncbi:hypothetical protein ID875_17080 [Streptomyces globisporus]|uniref:Uncharacterized protein n=1 Tax=Streptomyces globisporus TaxID=1908 RepID=A0A927GNJ2_STRGL|nr:hypothetical protein [Streptomyces globisporus]
MREAASSPPRVDRTEGPEAAPVRLSAPEERDPSRESADAGADEGAAPEPAVRAEGVPASRPAPPPDDRLTVPGAPTTTG